MGFGLRTAARASALAVAVALVASMSRAQSPPDEATRLFEQGKALFDAKKYAPACEALAASDKLDPSVGTLGLLAACHEAVGRIGTAFKEYRETAARAHKVGDNREAYAVERAAKLEQAVAHLTIRSAGHEADLSVVVDGAPGRVGEDVVDQGKHVVVASAPGKPSWRGEVDVGPREWAVVTIPGLGEGPDAAPPPGGAANEKAPGQTPPGPHDLGASRRTLGLVVGGVGLVGFVAAGVTGAMVLSKNDVVESECPGATCATQEGYDAAQAGKTLIVVNAIAWGIGAVGTGLGLYLFLSAPSAAAPTSSAAVIARPGGATLAWTGAF